MSRRLLVLAGALSGALMLSACGTADTATQPTRTIPGTAPSTTIATTTTVPNFACTPTTPVVPADGKPEVTIPEGAVAPPALETKDLKVGDGPEAKVGDKVGMQYVGKALSNGKEFDASWTRNAEPFSFTIAPPDPAVQGEVIKGWDQGVVGMKVGGRRLLVIPGSLAYQEAGRPPDIGPNDTLYFVVDLVQVCTPEATPVTAPGSTTTVAGAAGSTTTVAGAAGSTTTVAGTAGGSSTTAIPSSTPSSTTTTAVSSSTTATTATTAAP